MMTVAARSGVMNDVPPGEVWGGYPATSRKQWMRQQAVLAAVPGAKAARSAKPSGES
jgi:UDP-3-O-[3-hydroxymyristoyl] glucosamine N-acyltransferase